MNISDQTNPSVIFKYNVLSIPLKVCQAGYDFEGGLTDSATGKLIDEAIIIRHGKLQQILPVKTEAIEVISTVNNTIFYGGILFDNFGHFLLESLSRLWAYRFYAKEKLQIFFYCPWGVPEYRKKRNYVFQVFKGLDIPVKKIVFFDSPVKLKTIIIPEQQYGFGVCQNPGKDFLNFIHSFHSKEKLSVWNRRNEKIYVSRSALPYKMGRPLGETYFEKYLQQEGYLIFHPEKHTVYEQLSLYKNASQIIFCDGGATYCTILTPDIKADIAIVARRRDLRWNYKGVTEHFYGYKKNVLWIDEIICQYQFGLETWDAVAEVDWYKVSIELKENGFTQNNFSDLNKKETEKNKTKEIHQYILSIQANPLFLKYMLLHKEEYSVLPNNF